MARTGRTREGTQKNREGPDKIRCEQVVWGATRRSREEAELGENWERPEKNGEGTGTNR